jgi:hypothetical protein
MVFHQGKIDDLVKTRHPVEKRGPGVFNFLGTLDSPSAMLRVVSPSTLLRTVSLSNGSSNHGFCRNDEKNAFSTFYETIKIVRVKLLSSFMALVGTHSYPQDPAYTAGRRAVTVSFRSDREKP